MLCSPPRSCLRAANGIARPLQRPWFPSQNYVCGSCILRTAIFRQASTKSSPNELHDLTRNLCDGLLGRAPPDLWVRFLNVWKLTRSAEKSGLPLPENSPFNNIGFGRMMGTIVESHLPGGSEKIEELLKMMGEADHPPGVIEKHYLLRALVFDDRLEDAERIFLEIKPNLKLSETFLASDEQKKKRYASGITLRNRKERAKATKNPEVLAILCYKLMMDVRAKRGDIDGTLKVIAEVNEAGIRTDEVMCGHVLQACLNAGKPDEGLSYVERFISPENHGRPSRWFIWTVLKKFFSMKMFAETEKFVKILQLRPENAKLVKPSLYAQLMKSCIKGGDVNTAYRFFSGALCLPRGRLDKAEVYKMHKSMMIGCCRALDKQRAMELYSAMMRHRMLIDNVCFNEIGLMLFQLGDFESLWELYRYSAEKLKVHSTGQKLENGAPSISDTLIKAMLMIGDLDRATTIIRSSSNEIDDTPGVRQSLENARMVEARLLGLTCVAEVCHDCHPNLNTVEKLIDSGDRAAETPQSENSMNLYALRELITSAETFPIPLHCVLAFTVACSIKRTSVALELLKNMSHPSSMVNQLFDIDKRSKTHGKTYSSDVEKTLSVIKNAISEGSSQIINMFLSRRNVLDASSTFDQLVLLSISLDTRTLSRLIKAVLNQPGGLEKAKYMIYQIPRSTLTQTREIGAPQSDYGPDAHTFVHIINAARGTPNLIVDMWEKMKEFNVEPDPNICRSTLETFCLSGKTEEATTVYRLMVSNKFPLKLWDFRNLVSAHLNRQDVQGAIGWLHEMEAQGVAPTRDFVSMIMFGAIDAVVKSGADGERGLLARGSLLELASWAKTRSLMNSSQFTPALQKAVSITRHTEIAEFLESLVVELNPPPHKQVESNLQPANFNPAEIHKLDVVDYTQKIQALAFDIGKTERGPKTNNVRSALRIYREMRALDIEPTNVTIDALISVLGKAGNWAGAWAVFTVAYARPHPRALRLLDLMNLDIGIWRERAEASRVPGVTLCELIVRFPRLLTHPPEMAYFALMDAFASSNYTQGLEATYWSYLQLYRPVSRTDSIRMRCFGSNGHATRAAHCFSDMTEVRGVKPDLKIFTNLVRAFAGSNRQLAAVEWAGRMTGLGIPKDEIFATSVMQGFVNTRWLQAARSGSRYRSLVHFIRGTGPHKWKSLAPIERPRYAPWASIDAEFAMATLRMWIGEFKFEMKSSNVYHPLLTLAARRPDRKLLSKILNAIVNQELLVKQNVFVSLLEFLGAERHPTEKVLQLWEVLWAAPGKLTDELMLEQSVSFRQRVASILEESLELLGLSKTVVSHLVKQGLELSAKNFKAGRNVQKRPLPMSLKIPHVTIAIVLDSCRWARSDEGRALWEKLMVQNSGPNSRIALNENHLVSYVEYLIAIGDVTGAVEVVGRAIAALKDQEGVKYPPVGSKTLKTLRRALVDKMELDVLFGRRHRETH
ncbi:hypothetical protein BJ742DRAFT_808572 [Cladochytrium replicatum]|nr:hypothetical protein BJ742DRAFT_808572 [Cladochytrium replicatum]